MLMVMHSLKLNVYVLLDVGTNPPVDVCDIYSFSGSGSRTFALKTRCSQF